MRGERGAAEVADVLEPVPGPAGEAVDRVRNSEAQEVAGGRRELAAHEDQDALVVSLDRLGLQVVVVGDGEKAEAGLLRGGDDLVRRAAAVGKGRVHVDHPGHARVSVVEVVARNGQRAPEGDAQKRERPQGRRREQGGPEGPALSLGLRVLPATGLRRRPAS